MEWFSQNWVWVLFFVAFMAMHMFGHGGHGGRGGHGGHGGHRGSGGDDDAPAKPTGKDVTRRSSEPGAEHRH